MPIPSRRHFLRIASRSLASVGAASIFSRFGQINALAQSTCAADYKALVCVFLFGGNDGNNTVIPQTTATTNPNNSYSVYANVRKGLALSQSSLLPAALPNGDVYGLHPSLTGIANLFGSKNAAIVANVGTLVTPTTRSQYLAPGASVPSNLFSHLDQQQEWQSSIAKGFRTTGWGGRVADLMQSCNNPNFPTVLSVGGNTLFATGNQTFPATVTPGQKLGLQGYGTGSSARLTAFQDLLTFDNGVSLVQASNTVTKAGNDQATLLNQALTGNAAISTVFPATSIGQQLLQVAKIIQARNALGMRRQIFFAYLGGFDTHDLQLVDQGNHLMELSGAMKAFYDATVELNVANAVTAFTESDFGRTCQPSGGSTLGSDHAWGSHHFVVGGAVKGGNMYGQFPTLALTGPDDANTRGVWIPTTSLDQYAASLATWFGVDSGKLGQVFPNLGHFPSGLPAFV